jgi:radical SAM protein with 4Fe4S-binding SPASM domain
MVEILSMTKEYCPQAFVSLTTNGDLLDDVLYRDLKASGLDALGVSIYDDKIFEKVTRFGDRQMVLIDLRTKGEGILENRGGGISREFSAFEHDRIHYQNRSCERLFTMTVVNPRGQVVLCCGDLNGDVIMGNVQSERLEQIWNNERFTFYRNALNHEGRRNLPLCSECSYSGEGFRPFFPFSAKKPFFRLSDRIRSRLGLIMRSFES